MRVAIAFSALAVLTACGGGGGAVYVAPTGPGGLVDLYDESQSLSAEFKQRKPAEFGVAGVIGNTATFQGVMVVGKDSPGTTYVGDVSLLADFTVDADGDLSGSATGFYVYDSSGATGTVGSAVGGVSNVTLSASSLNGSTFPVTADGTLGGTVIGGTLNGQFGAVDFLNDGIDGGDTIDGFFADGTVAYDGSNWMAIIRACTDGILPSC